MATLTMRDGTEIFYKDWGTGRPVVFLHGWPLSGDAWDDQLKYVADRGFRAVAHDRRGHGRSDHPWSGYDFDTLADDVHTLLETLDLRDVTLVGHSMGAGEVARYVGRHGTDRLRQAVLLAGVPPLLMQTDTNPEGAPERVLESFKTGILIERSQFWQDSAATFYNADRPRNRVTQGNKDAFWFMAMQANIQASVACVDAYGRTDFTEDLRRFAIPTLIVHGDDDQLVPAEATGRKAAKLVPDATLKIHEGASHGLTLVAGEKERVNADLLEFLRS